MGDCNSQLLSLFQSRKQLSAAPQHLSFGILGRSTIARNLWYRGAVYLMYFDRRHETLGCIISFHSEQLQENPWNTAANVRLLKLQSPTFLILPVLFTRMALPPVNFFSRTWQLTLCYTVPFGENHHVLINFLCYFRHMLDIMHLQPVPSLHLLTLVSP